MLLGLALPQGPALAQGDWAGHVASVAGGDGAVRVEGSGGARDLAQDDQVAEQDTISTTAEGRAKIVLTDTTELLIGGGTKLQIKSFEYAAAPLSGLAILVLQAGVVTVAAGDLGQLEGRALEVRAGGSVVSFGAAEIVAERTDEDLLVLHKSGGKVRVKGDSGDAVDLESAGQATIVPDSDSAASEPADVDPERRADIEARLP